MPAANAIPRAVETATAINERPDGSREVTLLHHTRGGDLRERFWFPVDDASWHIEHAVKDPERDWPLYCAMFFDDPQGLDLSEVNAATEATGGQGVVSIYVGSPFTDWLCGARDGGYERVIYELLDRPAFFRPMQERYIAHVVSKARWLCEHARFDELFMGNEFSELPLLSPRLWREWDYPVMRAFCATAAEYGVVTHCHQHGSVQAILPDIAASGLNVLCPLEGPPGGDVNLEEVKRQYGGRLCLKGNVSTHLLLYGTPEQVREAVRACADAGKGAGGFILGTGDQVARDTPFENIEAFVAAGMEYGAY
jgi:uroporphyrinogen-III decarboxylase